MKEFSVEFPVLVKVYTLVKANTKEEAIDKAIKGLDISIKSDSGDYEYQEFEPYDNLLEGNFFYGSISEANAELEFDNEE